MGNLSSKIRNRSRKQSTKLDAWFPTREEEIDRLQILHHVSKNVWKSQFSAPVDQLLKGSARILDVGCGPGTWICDLASDKFHENSEFVGVDVLSIYPKEKPKNAKFINANVLEGLPFDDDYFDYVHMRNLLFFFTNKQWEHCVIKELIRVLKPGGWLELCEDEFVYKNAGPATAKSIETLHSVLRENNVNPLIVHDLENMLKKQNLQEVTRKDKIFGIGPWEGKVGTTILDNVRRMYANWEKYTGVSDGEANDTRRQVYSELSIYRTYFHNYRVYAQKV